MAINNDDKYIIDLYVEQIKYLRQENINIQDKFLSSTSIPVAVLGVFIYYIEKAKITSLYLLLPFLYFLIPYNLIKYTIRMLAINGYIKHMEREINILTKGNTFLWNSELINSSFFKGGFSTITTLAQVPLHFVSCLYLIVKFIETLSFDMYFKSYHTVLVVCMILEVLILILMLIDAVLIQKIIAKKIKKKGAIHNGCITNFGSEDASYEDCYI